MNKKEQLNQKRLKFIGLVKYFNAINRMAAKKEYAEKCKEKKDIFQHVYIRVYVHQFSPSSM